MATLTVNGKRRDFAAEPDTPLLWVLREQLGLTGTKFGCGIAQCGACTVHIDGVPTRSCVRPLSSVGADAKVVTIEGLSPDGQHPVQKAWAALDVPQCGYCQSGMIMAASALLEAKPNPSDADIDAAMTHICRCGTCNRVRAAIKVVAQGGDAKTASLDISYVAACSEVSVDNDGKLKVHRIVAATDCGYAVNPQQIEAQVEGSFAYGLSAALYGECTVKDGRIEQDNFHTYPVLKMDAMPAVETIVVASGGFWGGVGEPTIAVAAPAVLNAVFAATGKRIRDLPLKNHSLKRA